MSVPLQLSRRQILRRPDCVVLGGILTAWLWAPAPAVAAQQQVPPPPPSDTLARAVYDLGYEPGLNILRQGLSPGSPDAGRLLRLGAGSPADDTVLLARSIVSALGTAPAATGALGFSYRFDSATGVFARQSDTFGSTVTESAFTIGGGRVSWGFSFQSLSFGKWNGRDLDSGVEIDATSTGEFERETRTVRTRSTTSLSLDASRFAFFAVMGIIDTLDVTVIGSVSHLKLRGTSTVTLCNPACTHPFPVVSRSASSTGYDDMRLRAKYLVRSTRRTGLAVAGEARLKGGNSDQFHGTGVFEMKPYVLGNASFERAILQFDLGYLLAARPSDVDRFHKFQSADGLQFKAGAAFAATPRLTLSTDILTRSIGELTVRTNGRSNEVSLVIGGKLNIANRGLVTVSAVVPLSSAGLVPRVSPVVGFELAF